MRVNGILSLLSLCDVCSADCRGQKPGNRNPDSGIGNRNPESGIRNPESGIQNQESTNQRNDNETFIILQDSNALCRLYLYLISKLQVIPPLDNGVKMTSKRRSFVLSIFIINANVFRNVLVLELLFSTGKSSAK